MQYHVIVLDTTGKTYTFYERAKTRKTRKTQKKLSYPPQGMCQTLDKNELKKQHHYIYTE